MFYVVISGSTKTLCYNQIDASKALKTTPGSTVQTFRTRLEAVNFINKSDTNLKKSITIHDTHVLYVKKLSEPDCVQYSGELLSKEGKIYNFSGKTPSGITNEVVAEMMAYRIALDAYPADKFYFVSTMEKMVETYHQHYTSSPCRDGDPVNEMCLNTLDMMVSRGVIVSTVDPIIRS